MNSYLAKVRGAGLFLFSLTFLFRCNPSTQQEWELLHSDKTAHSAAFRPIFFVDEEHGWALTRADLLRLDGGGKTWVSILNAESGESVFHSFTFTSRSTGIVVGARLTTNGYRPLIIRTSDGGKTWQESLIDGEPEGIQKQSLQSVSFCNDTTGWAVGENLILHTKDGGVTWEKQRNENQQRLYSVVCTSSETAWAAGTEGLLLKTSDGGKNWLRRMVGTSDTLLQVRFYGLTGWLVGGSNGRPTLLRTTDAGETWRVEKLDVTAGLFEIFFIGNNGWLAGEKGTILHTADGGDTWIRQVTPTTDDVTSLFFITPTDGWAGGDGLTLFRFKQ